MTGAPLLITGLQRSGTSRLAHSWFRKGVLLGSSMAFPDPGNLGRPDWEDCSATIRLLQHLLGRAPHPRSWIEEYLAQRRAQHAALVAHHRPGVIAPFWGAKSPYWLPFIDLWPARTRIILTCRALEQTLASLRALHGTLRDSSLREKLIDIQYHLVPYWQAAERRAETVVPYAAAEPSDARSEGESEWLHSLEH